MKGNRILKVFTFFVFLLALSACITREKVLTHDKTCDSYSRYIIISSKRDTDLTRAKVKEWNSFVIESCGEKYEELYFKQFLIVE